MSLIVHPPKVQRQESTRKEIHAYGEVKGGDCNVFRRRDFLLSVADLEGKKVHVMIETADKRSDQHSRYYFGMLRALSMETGYDVEEIHEISKRECNTHIRHVLNRTTGEMQEKIFGGSTRKMRVGDFAEYVERVKRFWAEQGYPIADEYWNEEN